MCSPMLEFLGPVRRPLRSCAVAVGLLGMAATGGCDAASEGDAGDELAQGGELVPRVATSLARLVVPQALD